MRKKKTLHGWEHKSIDVEGMCYFGLDDIIKTRGFRTKRDAQRAWECKPSEIVKIKVTVEVIQ